MIYQKKNWKKWSSKCRVSTILLVHKLPSDHSPPPLFCFFFCFIPLKNHGTIIYLSMCVCPSLLLSILSMFFSTTKVQRHTIYFIFLSAVAALIWFVSKQPCNALCYAMLEDQFPVIKQL
jgi:hypothetical protein